MHGFWECPTAQKAWKWCEAIINHLSPAGEGRGRQVGITNNSIGRPSSSIVGTTSQGVASSGSMSKQRRHSNGSNEQGPRLQKLLINWKQGIFGHRLPNRFKRISRIWLFMRGIVIWHIWEQRNEAAFDGRQWHPAKLYHKLWLSMIDYSRMCWGRVHSKMGKTTNNQEKVGKLINSFRSS